MPKMNTNVAPAGMSVKSGVMGSTMTSSTEVQVPLIIEIETDLPNGNYIESNGGMMGSGGYTCHCSAETLYSTATEMATAKHQEAMNGMMAGANGTIGNSINGKTKMSASFTVQMIELQFKGGPANLSSAVNAGKHTLKLAQTQMISQQQQCCILL